MAFNSKVKFSPQIPYGRSTAEYPFRRKVRKGTQRKTRTGEVGIVLHDRIFGCLCYGNVFPRIGNVYHEVNFKLARSKQR